MQGIITVDVGTTSTRAILYDAGAQAIHTEQRETLPAFLPDGRVQQDAAIWQRVVPQLLQACGLAAAANAITPACIAVTAQRSSVIPVDAAGTPLHPAIMWQDRRAAALAQAMEAHNPVVYQRTGLRISPVFSAIKMTWLRRHAPDVWARTHKLLGVQDWVLHLLTGRYVTDHSFGSRTNLLDLHTRQWSTEMLALFEVPPERLCDLVPPGAVVGGLTAEQASATGLPAGLPVVSAGGDQQCAALGLGLFSGARAVCNTGTGSYLIGHAERPALDAGMRLACNVSAVPGAYIVEAAGLTTGTIYRWFNESIAGNAATDGSDAFAALNAQAAAAPPGANGLLLLPHFKGSGSPTWDPQARGVFYNVTLETTRGDMARAILEGIAIEMKASLELVEALCGAVGTVSVSGGLAKSDLFNQIQSDVLERPVQRFSHSEATSLGAWIAGAVATGQQPSYPVAFAHATAGGSSQAWQTNATLHALYTRQRQQARALFEALVAPALRAQLQ